MKKDKRKSATNNAIKQTTRKFNTIENCNIIKFLKMAEKKMEITIPGISDNSSIINT